MPGGKKKAAAQDSSNSQLGLLPDLSGLGVAGLQLPPPDDDASLEAELAALLEEDDDSDAGPSRRVKTKAPAPNQKVPLSEINKMAADAMKSIDDSNDEDVMDDDELLAELDELNESGPSPMPSPRPSPKVSPQLPPKQVNRVNTIPDIQRVLKDRLDNYKAALANAEIAGESSKASRYGRGLKTLIDLQKKVQTGRKIDESEIPPMVAVGNLEPPSGNQQAILNNVISVPSTHGSGTQDNQEQADSTVSPLSRQRREQFSPQGSATTAVSPDSQLAVLKTRQNQYKAAALQAKQSGDMVTASDYVKVMKQFGMVIGAVENGEEVDLSGMPPPPGVAPAPSSTTPVKEHKVEMPAVQVDAPTDIKRPQPQALPEMPRPNTVLEALQQRAARYKDLMDRAKSESNTSKARRMDRARKQYMDAIKKVKLAKPVDYNELPSLPDFPPIPTGGHSGAESTAAAKPLAQQLSPAAKPLPRQVSPAAAQPVAPTLPPKTRAVAAGSAAGQQAPSPSQRRVPPQSNSAAEPGIDPKKQLRLSANQRQLQTLQERKKKLMGLALKAKNEGDMEEAKRLLKMAKGFEPMIQAAENGLPVNMDSIPDVPGEVAEMAQECVEELGGDPKELYSRLKETLSKQIKLSATCEKQYAQLGNVATVKRFREMLDSCQQDLDVLLVAQSHGDAVPRFHYEMRTIPTIRVNADLKETEAEVTIIQGIGFKAPSGINDADLDTFVKYEFPYPTDNPQSHKCGWGKGSENPQYNGHSKVHIVRSRTLLSVVKRKAVKFEVYYRKGLLRGDKILAVANLKLAELENKCEVHDSVQLMEGRKPVAGKLEVKVRIHHPLSGVKEDHAKEKWLVIDATLPAGAKSKLKGGSGSPQTRSPSDLVINIRSLPPSNMPDSVEVLKWEMMTLKKKMADLQRRGKAVPKEIVAHQSGMQERCQKLQFYLKEGGKGAKIAHLLRLESAVPLYLAHAKEALQAGQKDKATMFMNKKKLVENEIASLKS